MVAQVAQAARPRPIRCAKASAATNAGGVAEEVGPEEQQQAAAGDGQRTRPGQQVMPAADETGQTRKPPCRAIIVSAAGASQPAGAVAAARASSKLDARQRFFSWNLDR